MRAVLSDGEVKAHDTTALLLDQKSLVGVRFSVDKIFRVGTIFHDDLTDDVDNFLALQDTGMCASLNHPHTLPTLPAHARTCAVNRPLVFLNTPLGPEQVLNCSTPHTRRPVLCSSSSSLVVVCMEGSSHGANIKGPACITEHARDPHVHPHACQQVGLGPQNGGVDAQNTRRCVSAGPMAYPNNLKQCPHSGSSTPTPSTDMADVLETARRCLLTSRLENYYICNQSVSCDYWSREGKKKLNF